MPRPWCLRLQLLSGIATSLGLLPLAWGALVLFLTNIVAIVLGVALSLWAVGLRSRHEHGPTESWTWRVAVPLVLMLLLLGLYELIGVRH